MSNLLNSENVYQTLKKEAKSLDTTIADLCVSAGVDRSHVQYWLYNTPSTICNLVKLNKEIQERKKRAGLIKTDEK